MKFIAFIHFIPRLEHTAHIVGMPRIYWECNDWYYPLTILDTGSDILSWQFTYSSYSTQYSEVCHINNQEKFGPLF